jgi:hypothetical protein
MCHWRRKPTTQKEPKKKAKPERVEEEVGDSDERFH